MAVQLLGIGSYGRAEATKHERGDSEAGLSSLVLKGKPRSLNAGSAVLNCCRESAGSVGETFAASPIWSGDWGEASRYPRCAAPWRPFARHSQPLRAFPWLCREFGWMFVEAHALERGPDAPLTYCRAERRSREVMQFVTAYELRGRFVGCPRDSTPLNY